MSAPHGNVAAVASSFPKATLYTFAGSMWGSVPLLGLVEKGYSKDDLEIRTVDLTAAENFSPTYLRINSNATVPTLVVPLSHTTGVEVDTKYRAITDSAEVLEFLDQSRNQAKLDAKGDADARPAPVLAPATIEGKAKSDELIKLVHSEEAEGNFLLLSARDQSELEAQRKGMQGGFVGVRLHALAKYLAEAKASRPSSENPRDTATAERLIKWYETKLSEEALTVAAYLGDTEANSVPGISAPKASAAQTDFIAQSRAAWRRLPALLRRLEAGLATPYALGDQLSLADVHITAWLARVFFVAQAKARQAHGATEDEVRDEVAALKLSLRHESVEDSAPLGEKLIAYWKLLKTRPAFQEVYAAGLH